MYFLKCVEWVFVLDIKEGGRVLNLALALYRLIIATLLYNEQLLYNLVNLYWQ